MRKPRQKHFRPPDRFHPAGDFQYAEFSYEPPSFIKPHKVTGARARGIRYEEKGQRHMDVIAPGRYVPGPWFRYVSADNHRYWCQPDGLLFDFSRGTITIVEFKLKHTSDAWWQTRRLYEPVVKAVFGEELWRYSIVEIVKWFDSETTFPESFNMARDPTDLTIGSFNVHIWGRTA